MTLHLQNQTISLDPINYGDNDSSLLAIIQSYSVLAPQFLLISRASQIATIPLLAVLVLPFTESCLSSMIFLKDTKLEKENLCSSF